MWNVYVREHILPYTKIDSRVPDVNSSVGSGTTSTRIYFNPPIPAQTDQIWVGGMIVITSGLNKGMGANISASANITTTLSYVDVSEEFASTPETGSSFALIRRDASGEIAYGNSIQIDKFVDSFSATTSIDKGYETLTLQINSRFSNVFTAMSSFVGMNIIVEDEYCRMFDGIIVDVEYAGNGGNISCVGYAQTFSWFQFEKIYDSSPTNTSPKILKDICDVNPYIRKLYIGIDRNDAWDTAQVAMSGIGPRNYTESVVTCTDAIKDITDMGYFGVSYQNVYLQVYNNAVPVLKIIDKAATPDYAIGKKNFVFGSDGFSVKSSIVDAYSEIVSSYNTDGGVTLYTTSAVNVGMISKVGRRKKMITSGEGGLAEKTAMVRVANNDFGTFLSASNFRIVGKISCGGTTTHVPVHRIKAGDLVTIEPPTGFDAMFKNQYIDVTKFVVGKTSYDSSSRVMTITPIENSLQSEIFAARVKL